MIMGILSLIGGTCLIVPPILAVIFGHVAVSACKKDPLLDGKGMAIAGLAMGWICLAFGGMALLFAAGLSNQH